jgi:hypothetical protein
MFWFDLPTCLLPLSPSGWWFGTFFIFHNIWDVILPIDDLHHFSRWLLHHQPFFGGGPVPLWFLGEMIYTKAGVLMQDLRTVPRGLFMVARL